MNQAVESVEVHRWRMDCCWGPSNHHGIIVVSWNGGSPGQHKPWMIGEYPCLLVHSPHSPRPSSHWSPWHPPSSPAWPGTLGIVPGRMGNDTYFKPSNNRSTTNIYKHHQKHTFFSSCFSGVSARDCPGMGFLLRHGLQAPWQLSAWNATNKEVVKIGKHQVKLRHFGAKMS